MAATASDAQIKQDILDDLRHDVRIDETNVSVDVTDGVVHLSGSVPTYAQKVTASHDVQRIKGVRNVVDDLAVVPVGVWADEETTRTMRKTFDRDARITNPTAIDVSVDNGVVTLTGRVASLAEKASAVGDAWVIPGVVEVIDNLTIVPAQRRRDSDIAADVRYAITNDPSLDATNIRVDVANGVVTLRGVVPTYYEIQQAAHDTWCVPGVRDVVNNLSIAL